jgi:hypothetical protein
MIDPLVLKAKDGTLSLGELESVLTELSELLIKRRIDPSFAYPQASKIDRLRTQLTDHDLAAASRELHGTPTYDKPSPSVVKPSGASHVSGAKPARDPYVLLEIVGEAGGKELAKSVEPFLDWPGDPMVAMLALEILTTYWGLAHEYRDTIIQLMKGVPWDVDNDVREVAISGAGEALRQQRDVELLQNLIDIAEDIREPSAIRGQAIAGLARAEGMSWQEIPNPADAISPVGRLARAILDRARAMTVEPDRS